MLDKLYAGNLQAQNVIIEDTTETPGRLLIMMMLRSMCDRYDQVLLLASERVPTFFTNGLPAALREKVRIPALPQLPKIGVRLPVGPLIKAVLNGIQGSNMSVGVVMDSVTTMVFMHSCTAVPQLIHSLLNYEQDGNKVQQVVSLIHADIHSEPTCRTICGHPDVFIRMQPPSSPHLRHCCSIHFGGAYLKSADSVEEFNFKKDFSGVQDVISKSDTENIQTDDDQTKNDPTANLTFNLSLKPEEKAAKDQVVLPYTQVTSPGSQTGLIHYIPDDDDDFDDDDPDEDLEF